MFLHPLFLIISYFPQPAAQRLWPFLKQMAHTNYTASSGSPLPQMLTWLWLSPEFKTELEQPHQYSLVLAFCIILLLLKQNHLQNLLSECFSIFVLQGSKGLSLFYAEVSRDKDGLLQGIEVQRLKDKLGTRQMPTAELLLDGLPAYRVSFMQTSSIL